MNLIRVKQVAKMLDITERTIWNKIKRGELPTIRVAGITRIDGDKLQALMGTTVPYDVRGLAGDGYQRQAEGDAQ